MSDIKKQNVLSVRPPIVVVVGHVDHGKTTLLDTIRKSNITAREHGGITQHIGAYQVKLPSLSDKGNSFLITFIDTPGHEAFSKMRSRGAKIADLAVLVVAADDSVKPQTIEAINQVKEAGIPILVAVNKVDLPSANIDKVKKDLAKVGVQVEGYGGDVPIIPISAKMNTGIKELLEMIQLISTMKDLTILDSADTKAIVIETKLDKTKGKLISLIIISGLLQIGTEVYVGSNKIGKVRAMYDEYGENVSEASLGKPVEVIGFSDFPDIGSVITIKPIIRTSSNDFNNQKVTNKSVLPDFLKPLNEQIQKIPVVLKADSAGTMEAIILSISDRINIVYKGVGNINENDIMFAKSSGAFVIAFNVKCESSADKLAQAEKVIFRIYSIIYELLDDLSDVVDNIDTILKKERELGSGIIIAEFPYDNQIVAGVKVTQGRLSKGDNVKIMRNEQEICKLKIKSMRHGKDEINKTETGKDCGVLFDRKFDFKKNDVIIAVT
jgi:translation initiation factor IF-2